MKYGLLLLVMGLMNGQVFAEDNRPSSCQPQAVQGDSVTLSTKKAVLVMIHNLSQTDLWITHPVTEASANAGWTSRLQANQWSALVLDKESFELTCIESKPGHEQQIPCVGVIAVCQWPTVTIPEQQTGTYWAGENMDLPDLTTHLGSRGFVLPAKAQ